MRRSYLSVEFYVGVINGYAFLKVISALHIEDNSAGVACGIVVFGEETCRTTAGSICIVSKYKRTVEVELNVAGVSYLDSDVVPHILLDLRIVDVVIAFSVCTEYYVNESALEIDLEARAVALICICKLVELNVCLKYSSGGIVV